MNAGVLHPAAFLDRDDTLVADLGYCRRAEQLEIARLATLLGAAARPDAHYYCPHHPTEALGLDVTRSIAIGDHERDMEAARTAGVRVAVKFGEPGVETFERAVEMALRRIRATHS